MCEEVKSEIIQIDLSDEDRLSLAEMYMDKNYSDASKKLFIHQRSIGRSFEEAFCDAGINEIVIAAISEKIIKETVKQEHFTNDE